MQKLQVIFISAAMAFGATGCAMDADESEDILTEDGAVNVGHLRVSFEVLDLRDFPGGPQARGIRYTARNPTPLVIRVKKFRVDVECTGADKFDEKRDFNIGPNLSRSVTAYCDYNQYVLSHNDTLE